VIGIGPHKGSHTALGNAGGRSASPLSGDRRRATKNRISRIVASSKTSTDRCVLRQRQRPATVSTQQSAAQPRHPQWPCPRFATPQDRTQLPRPQARRRHESHLCASHARTQDERHHPCPPDQRRAARGRGRKGNLRTTPARGRPAHTPNHRFFRSIPHERPRLCVSTDPPPSRHATTPPRHSTEPATPRRRHRRASKSRRAGAAMP
jgi:hypothetical protein